MNIKTILTACFFLLGISAYSQADMWKLTLKSDVVLVCYPSDYTDSVQMLNEYTTRYFVKINQGEILKNRTKFIPARDGLVLSPQDGEDYFSAVFTQGAIISPIGIVIGLDVHVPAGLFFLKKTGKTYEVLAKLEGHSDYDAVTDVNKILALVAIENTTDPKLRYHQFLNWFVDNGHYPSEDFLSFYRQKGFLGDSLVLNDSLSLKAKQRFLEGREALFPLVETRYAAEVKAYFMKKLKAISDKTELDFYDYWEFDKTVMLATHDFGENYNSMDYLLNNLLTSDKIDESEKREIMNHLMEVVKNWGEK